jgi:glyoxylase-like metal-dependent hydrolase (beta-lactamase superfamily II)
VSDALGEAAPPPPVVEGSPREVAEGVHVIADRRVPLVPNIGIVLGDDKALVVDTGMGPANGAYVRAAAEQLAGDRELLLTITHFHPEHGFGAQAFADVPISYNRAQLDELHDKGAAYLDMFRTFGPGVADALDEVELVDATSVYDGDSHELDLGGRVVELRTWGQAHTRSDQVVIVRDAGVLFAGDLVEEKCFPIFPYFPPDDADVDGDKWIAVLERIEKLRPEVVVPGHGDVGGVSIVGVQRDFMTTLRDETRRLRSEGSTVDAAAEALDAQMRELHPDWLQPEWIGFGVRQFYAAS